MLQTSYLVDITIVSPFILHNNARRLRLLTTGSRRGRLSTALASQLRVRQREEFKVSACTRVVAATPPTTHETTTFIGMRKLYGI